MTFRIVCIVFVFITSAFIISCSNKKDHDHEHEEKEVSANNEWKQMDDFHMVMAETFHPYKDSADLSPVKSKAKELVNAATAWASAPIPEKADNEEMKTKLQELKGETEVLADLVQTNNTDEAIGKQLTKVHDLFHTIQESWYGGHGHEH